MAASNSKYSVEIDGMVINLRQPIVAAILGWLIPGAGHFYQGRYGKAGLFFCSIISLFIIGMVIGHGRVVYSSWTVEDRRWHYVCQVGVGLPALPALMESRLSKRNQPSMLGIMYPPKNMDELDKWHNDSSAGFDLGTLYTMIAGLLNMLVVLDAFAGPLPLPQNNKKDSASELSKKNKSNSKAKDINSPASN